MDVLLAAERNCVSYKPLQKFPSVERDVTFTSDKVVLFSDVVATINGLNNLLCRAVHFVGVFESNGQRSLTLRVIYNREDRTLTDSEVEASHNLIVAKVQEIHALTVNQ